ncbi:endothelin-converting enzyme 2 [Phalaenopsis equestris]|uniref:endothelin-converting enzyme 2 n=1 Tax=Phalaenopsis equestris TaxID=78828 RepID=UPI0009E2CA4E|nr:endothelin-converting enzyme 2 [Phalaenopsis equestris]
MAIEDEEITGPSNSGRNEPAVDFLPKTASAYGDPRYWSFSDSIYFRFTAEEHYEWLKEYSHFQHLILPNICPEHSILELGCGNSQLSEDLHGEGVIDVTCIDLSAIAVQRMRQRLKEKGIKVIQADMLDLPFESESFDIVIEKGTMDVLYVDSGDPWNPRSDTVSKVMQMLTGVHKVLKPDGIFISISFGQPHFRRQLFEAPCFTWSVEWKTFGEGFHYFVYTLKKGRRSCESKYPSIDDACVVPGMSLIHDELDDEDFIFRVDI